MSMKIRTWKREEIELGIMDELTLRLLLVKTTSRKEDDELVDLHPESIARLKEIRKKLWD
jgi:hypothetical protein